MGYGPPPNPSAPSTPPAGSTVSPAPVPTGPPYGPPPRRPSRVGTILGAIAVLLAGSALGVSLVRKPAIPTPQSAPPTSSAVPAQEVFVNDADRALCEAIAPLMKESDERARAFSAFPNNSPEQKAALPDYRTFTQDWSKRLQVILNSHAQPPRYLTRTLQRFIDDTLLYTGVDAVGDEIGVLTWKMSLIDYGGPLARCSSLGISW